MKLHKSRYRMYKYKYWSAVDFYHLNNPALHPTTQTMQLLYVLYKVLSIVILQEVVHNIHNSFINQMRERYK